MLEHVPNGSYVGNDLAGTDGGVTQAQIRANISYAMNAADVDSICAAPPAPMSSGMKSAAVAPSGLANAAIAAAPMAKRGTIKRDLTQAQALAVMRSQQPVH